MCEGVSLAVDPLNSICWLHVQEKSHSLLAGFAAEWGGGEEWVGS